MPFQVIYSEFSRAPGVINSFACQPDFSAVCDVQITLSATVDGDLFGHTIVWEQISGTPVTFTTPLDQFVIEYLNGTGSPVTGSVFDDKVFRFTIDKGSLNPTSPEQFCEVNVFGAPTDLAYSGSGVIQGSTSYRNCNVPTCFRTSLGPSGLTDGAGCGLLTGTLFWEPPRCPDIDITMYQIEEYTPGLGFAIVETLSPEVRRFDGVVSGRSYKLITHLANGAVDVGCVQWLNPDKGFAQSRNTNDANADNGSVISAYGVITRKVIFCAAPVDDTSNAADSGGSGSVISAYGVITRTVIQCLDAQILGDANASTNDADSAGTGSVISNFDVLAIGGTQVGG